MKDRQDSGRHVLHMQEEQGDHRSPSSPLLRSSRIVGFDLPTFWCRVGPASKSGRIVGWLKRSIGKSFHFRSLEDGSSMLNVVHLKRVKREF